MPAAILRCREQAGVRNLNATHLAHAKAGQQGDARRRSGNTSQGSLKESRLLLGVPFLCAQVSAAGAGSSRWSCRTVEPSRALSSALTRPHVRHVVQFPSPPVAPKYDGPLPAESCKQLRSPGVFGVGRARWPDGPPQSGVARGKRPIPVSGVGVVVGGEKTRRTESNAHATKT